MRKLACVVSVLVIAITAYSEFIPASTGVDRTQSTITRSDDNMLIVDFTFPGVDIQQIEYNGEYFDLVSMENAGSSGVYGAPDLPVITRLFAIPDRAKGVIKSFQPVYKTVENIRPLPLQDDLESPGLVKQWQKDDSYYSGGNIFPDKWVDLGKPAILRDYRIIPVTVNPVRFDAVSGKALVLISLHLEIEFENNDSENIKTHNFSRTVPTFNNLYGNLIQNYDWITPNGEEALGSLLIIYPEVANVLNTIQPLIEWKTRKGYHTVAQSIPNNSTPTVVQQIIQNAYDTFDPPLEYVILIGDAAGNINVPCGTFHIGPYGADSDHFYTLLEGDDILADITIGRYSCSNTTELMTEVNKVLYYEKAPMMVQTDWYKKGAVMAPSSSCGISPVFTQRMVRGWWFEDGFTSVDSMWYFMGGSAVTFSVNAINNGVTAFSHRGYIGMFGLSQSQIYALTNYNKLPFVVIMECGSGAFGASSKDHSEAFFAAGSPNNHIGAIGCVGYSIENHTRFSNTAVAGIWFGQHAEGLTQLGPMTFRGKMEVYQTFQGTSDYDWMVSNLHSINLMGDPTTDMWTDIPQITTVMHLDSISAGTTNFSVTVCDAANNPLEDRYVCLWKGAETYTAGRTDANGVFSSAISTPTAGTMKITVTYHNDYPYLTEIPVFQSAVYPSFDNVVIDDDNLGLSAGNSDGFANPSETLELDIALKNFGSSTAATGLNAVLSCEDDAVEVLTAVQNYTALNPGAVSFGAGKFLVRLGSYFPQSYIIPFTLTISCNEGVFVSAFEIEVNSGQCQIAGGGTVGGNIQPGASADLILRLQNTGEWNLEGVTAALTSGDPQISIIDNLGAFGNIPAGGEAINSMNPFVIQADEYATIGRKAALTLQLTSSNGFTQEIPFEIEIGNLSASNPFGPDDYGYYCIDNTDIYYDNHPRYDWVEIDPAYGGAGTRIDLSDFGSQQDTSAIVLLPFDFTFYGESFDTITVCSNGWIGMGDERYHFDFRNYPMSTAFGPDRGMLCPFWDDMIIGAPPGNYLYYFDAVHHRLIIEYSRVHCGTSGGGPLETFEAILYDPEFYITPTGDGEFIFQYHTVNIYEGPYSDNKYFTTGIQNNDHSDGLQYAYWNIYNPGAAVLEAGRAIKFTTIEPHRFPVPTNIEVTIEPINPPIVIPAAGGSFDYNLSLTNPNQQYSVFDLWIKAFMPNGQDVYITFMYDYELPAGQTDQFDLHQVVPGRAPAGLYFYYAFIGDYDNEVLWDTSFFNFTKTGVDLTGGSDWLLTGWEGKTEADEPVIPAKFALHPPFPNPFNASAVIEYDIPSDCYISLEVFDISGKLTASLYEGFRPKGSYRTILDASGMTSGLYFVRFTSGDHNETRKLVLVK